MNGATWSAYSSKLSGSIVAFLLFTHSSGSNSGLMAVIAHSCQSFVDFEVKTANPSTNFAK